MNGNANDGVGLLGGAALRLGYRLASRVIYGRGDYGDWAFERMQRPSSALILARNFAARAVGRPHLAGVVSMAVEPSFGCNLRCRTCWGRYDLAGLRPALLPFEVLRRAVERAPRSVESVVFALGGEPLLNPQLPEMVRHVASSGRRAMVVTNGTLLDGEVGTELSRTPLAVLTVSVEVDPEQSRKVRGTDLDEVEAKLRRFVERKNPGTAVNLSVVIHADNVGRLHLLRERFGDVVSGIKLSPEVSIEPAARRVHCREPWRGNVCVLSSGEVTLCCFDLLGDLVVGDLRRDPLARILDGQAVRRLLADEIAGRLPDRCTHCHQFEAPGVPRRLLR